MSRYWIPNPTGKGRQESGNSPTCRKFIEILFQEYVSSGKSMTAFSRDVGLSVPIVSQWFNGKRKSAMIETVVRVWKVLGRSMDKDFL